MTTPEREPRIYVASLTDYNAGRLVGEWIDATQDADTIGEQVQAMLNRAQESHPQDGPFEEWAIHDYDDFGSLDLGEYASFETVSTIANLLALHGKAFEVWRSNGYGGSDADSWGDEFENDFHGCYDSPADYAREFAEETGSTTCDIQWPYTCIDWDQAAQELDGVSFIDEGYHETYVFIA